MDADLQDPIDLIPQLLSKLSEGFDVVYARRRDKETRYNAVSSMGFLSATEESLRY